MRYSKDPDYSIYLITDRRSLGERTLELCVKTAIEGGVTLVQLREKGIGTRDYCEIALRLKAVTDRQGVPLIINDRVDVALAVDAAGVHLGPLDMQVDVARRLMGPDKIIGASANCIEEALELQSMGADYLGVGALFATSTKSDTESVTLEQLKAIKSSVNIPIVGIGGINTENAVGVKNTGVDGIAAAASILAAENIYDTVRTFKKIWASRSCNNDY